MDSKTAERIAEGLGNLNGKITLGIDGFVDEVWQVIKVRTGPGEYVLFDKMKELGEAIVQCETGGFSPEIIRKRRSYGGFTGNTGLALGRLGLNPAMIGTYGKNGIDPAFEILADSCELFSIGDPCPIYIYEFEDGKMMFADIDALQDYEWDAFIKDLGRFEKILLGSDIIALGYWSCIHAFDELVTKICENFIEGGRCKKMFFDFADLRKRDGEALRNSLECLAELNKKVPMIWSLNENEAAQLYSHFGEVFDETKLEETIARIRGKTGLSELVIHTPYAAAVSNEEEGVAAVKQNHCPNPVKTVGAGDTFNAGYMAACLCGFGAAERLITANAATRFYVSNGYPPEVNDIINTLVLY